jgi:multidrug resistance efflux pump
MTTPPPKLGTRLTTTGTILIVAAIAIGLLWWRMLRHPWTRDGQVYAHVISVAPRVTGVVTEVGVADNQRVARGDLLFRIDPADFELAVDSARVQLEQARRNVSSLEAAVVASEAGVNQAETGLTTARAQIEAAEAQVESALGAVEGNEAGMSAAQAAIAEGEASLEQAIKDRDRAARLAADKSGSVARAESTAAAVKEKQVALEGTRAGLLEAQATLGQVNAALRQAEACRASAEAGLGEAVARLASERADLGAPGDANVQIRSAEVALSRSQLDLERSAVRASVDGYATNLNVDVVDDAAPGTPILALVDTALLHVRGFFRETQLGEIEPGDRAVVTLMSHRGEPIEGTVESIGWAINPPGVATTEGAGGLVPQVKPSFDWIRLAQRVPVRIRIGESPDGVCLVSATTASIVNKPGD